MATHELDTDREAARSAINSLAPCFEGVGFAPLDWSFPPEPDSYLTFPLTPPDKDLDALQLLDPTGDFSKHAKLEIEGCDALILLTSSTLSPFCLVEYHVARVLGLPCRVFARTGIAKQAALERCLTALSGHIVEYTDPGRDLAERVREFCRSLLMAPDEKREATVENVNVWRMVVRELFQDPGRVFALPPRKFEELLAEIISSFGYQTRLTPSTRDGGFDIVATRKDPLFPSLYLVEAKLWTPPRSVGRPVIQSIYGTGMAENCNGVMVVTPSLFSRDARLFVEEKRLTEFVRLVDGTQLPSIYKRYLEGRVEFPSPGPKE